VAVVVLVGTVEGARAFVKGGMAFGSGWGVERVGLGLEGRVETGCDVREEFGGFPFLEEETGTSSSSNTTSSSGSSNKSGD